jgi:hypothetical protein
MNLARQWRGRDTCGAFASKLPPFCLKNCRFGGRHEKRDALKRTLVTTMADKLARFALRTAALGGVAKSVTPEAFTLHAFVTP